MFSCLLSDTVEPLYNEVLGTMKITLLYQVSHYIRVKKQRNIKSWDQQNDLVIRGFCYIRPLYIEIPLYYDQSAPAPRALATWAPLHKTFCRSFLRQKSGNSGKKIISIAICIEICQNFFMAKKSLAKSFYATGPSTCQVLFPADGHNLRISFHLRHSFNYQETTV